MVATISGDNLLSSTPQTVFIETLTAPTAIAAESDITSIETPKAVIRISESRTSNDRG